MSFDVVKADLMRMYASGPDGTNLRRLPGLTDMDVQRWASLTGISQQALCDQIGLYLAHGFARSELTFYFCDGVANDICRLITSWPESWPELFWKVYLAFDDGEYPHKSDGDGEDPVALYTVPQIKEIVEAHPERV